MHVIDLFFVILSTLFSLYVLDSYLSMQIILKLELKSWTEFTLILFHLNIWFV